MLRFVAVPFLLVHLLLFASFLFNASQLHDLAFAGVPSVDDVPALAGVLNTTLATVGVPTLPNCDPAVARVLFCYS